MNYVQGNRYTKHVIPSFGERPKYKWMALRLVCAIE